MIYDNVRWPSWRQVYDLWNSLDVPDVEILAFRLREWYPRSAWFDREAGRQSMSYSNPQGDTAYHLCKVLPARPPELRAAYKLYAYCCEYDIDGIAFDVLAPIFERHESALNQWWSGNAKYVLPPHSRRYSSSPKYVEQARGWRALVQDAAAVWHRISDRWAVIRIPDYMDQDSAEYQDYHEYEQQLYEKRERQEYERLKRKFDGN